ncbi:hypothetical protein [Streptomyces sp. BE147]|uniref:hypothetical protein n=1 Tax=unclassified Streptomyces TaxID=2593676 RepID=UPI002E7961DE|nr:hypothetical protein [Streptomyces sp. BE147]MEE1735697.1 hypothetical protein [Streptomyces sp. BE147]
MTSGNRQRRRDGAPKRAQLTSGSHSGPKDKRKGKGKTGFVDPPEQQKQAAAKRQWKALFARLEDVRAREQKREQHRAAGE